MYNLLNDVRNYSKQGTLTASNETTHQETGVWREILERSDEETFMWGPQSGLSLGTVHSMMVYVLNAGFSVSHHHHPCLIIGFRFTGLGVTKYPIRYGEGRTTAHYMDKIWKFK